MTGKKKNMDGGQFFGSPKPIFTNEHSTYLQTIQALNKRYKAIDPRSISVNNLNTKVISLNKFSKLKKNNSLQPLFEQLKLQLIDKIKSTLHFFIDTNFKYDYSISLSENLDNLLHQLKEFEKLLNQLKLLDPQSDLNYYYYSEQNFIKTILGKYENYIEQILRNNPNIEILQQLYQQVQNYIKQYKYFIENMNNNRKRNNTISEIIIGKLNNLSDQISSKIQHLSGQVTNNNAMKRRINILYKENYNKGINYNRILGNLHDKYKNEHHGYNLKELISLAEIGSKIESISRISNTNKNNKNILLRDLKKTIKSLKESLNKYPEFQDYERIIIPA